MEHQSAQLGPDRLLVLNQLLKRQQDQLCVTLLICRVVNQVLEVAPAEGSVNRVDQGKAFLSYLEEGHLFGPIHFWLLTYGLLLNLKSQSHSQILNLELSCLQVVSEIIAELPNMQ